MSEVSVGGIRKDRKKKGQDEHVLIVISSDQRVATLCSDRAN